MPRQALQGDKQKLGECYHHAYRQLGSASCEGKESSRWEGVGGWDLDPYLARHCNAISRHWKVCFYCIISSREKTFEQHPPNIKLRIPIHCGTVACPDSQRPCPSIPRRPRVIRRPTYLEDCSSGCGRRVLLSFRVIRILCQRCHRHSVLSTTRLRRLPFLAFLASQGPGV